MKKVPTIKAIFKNYEEDTIIFNDPDKIPVRYFTEKQTKQLMIEFAKMHVEKALEFACDKLVLERGPGSGSIVLNSYPLTNIK
jgi:hypothetical protein